MAWKAWIGVLAIACGPVVGGDEAAGETGGGGTDASTDGPMDEDEDEDGDPPAPDLPAPAPEWSEEEQLCIDFCTNLQGSACGRADESCFTWCMQGVALDAAGDCAEIEREVLECEAANPIDAGCESTACEGVYRRADFCFGSCSHLGGSPGEGSSQTDCTWTGGCYGHEFEMICPAGASLEPCSCRVDGEEIAQCELEEPLVPFECGSEDVHIFTGCCGDAFGEVLLP